VAKPVVLAGTCESTDRAGDDGHERRPPPATVVIVPDCASAGTGTARHVLTTSATNTNL
jgi:hypothetical protein